MCSIFNTVTAQIQFIQNKGQWNKAVQYKSEIPNGAFYLEQNGFTVSMQNAADLDKLAALMHGHAQGNEKEPTALPTLPITIKGHAYKVNFLNSNANVQVVPEKKEDTYNNYFIGNDKSMWQSNCNLFGAIVYKNMYPNIDVRYYTESGTLKYDIIVYPGGSISDIEMEYVGVDGLSIKNKELIIATSIGNVKELYPYTYQTLQTGKQVVNCKYIVKNKKVKFDVKEYNPSATIVIDPTVIFCSFTGSVADNWGYTATYDADGNMYAGGIAYGTGYPTTVGAFNTNFNGGTDEDGNGGYDIGIIKLSSNGRRRLFATYLGGNGNEQPHSLICDALGDLVVAGRTNSSTTNGGGRNAFPMLTPFVGNAGGYDIFIAKFKPDGSALIGSIRIGGSNDDGVNIKPKFVPIPPAASEGAYDTRRNYGDDARSEVIVDGANNIFLASCTQSNNFPVINSIIDNALTDNSTNAIRQDGAIIKCNAALNTVMFSTYFGGSGNDACFVLSISPLTGNLYVAGATTSTDLPGNKSGVLSPTFQGGITDGFVTQILTDGSAIVKTTYIGTNDNSADVNTDGNDLVYGIQFDKFGFPYIAGTTTGNWQAFNAVFSNTGAKQFIGKLMPDLSGYIYTTMFGSVSSVPNISITAMLVDRCQNVYVSGWGGGFNNRRGYPCAGTNGMPITTNATQSSTDGKDFYFFVLERNAASQYFGSYFGQSGGFDDHVDGGTSRFDANGIIYQGVCANCGNTPGVFFPTTSGAWATRNGSSGCNQAAVKIEMNFSGIGASVKATINGVIDTIGCLPLTVRFIDTLARGKKYIWVYNDGSGKRDTTYAPNNSVSHVYNTVGTYRLMLVSIDSLTCNVADTAYISVKVGNNVVRPNFTAVKIGDCQSTTFQFTNTTTAALPRYTNNTFLWNFGDGSPTVRAGFTTVTHTYASPGTYDVKLLVDDTTFCNAPQDTVKKIRLAINVKAAFITKVNGCVPYTASFENTSLGGTDFIWDFGEGPLVLNNSPIVTYTYNRIGNYTVKLVALDTSTCNKKDSTTFLVTVFDIPTADFDFSPKPGLENKPIFFTNQSIGANAYVWNFGDGDTSIIANPSHVFNETKKFNVCLIAANIAGCKDTLCKEVEAKVIPLLDVPNAFTPGKFGENAIVKVAGFGIGKLDWKIYNRWGQLVFSTTNRRDGWDGRFKGVIQAMDVYTYTLQVEFTDGKKLTKTGDITLLR